MCNEKQPTELNIYIDRLVTECGGIRPAARYLGGVNPGIIANVLDGGDSPTLWAIANEVDGLRKWPPRPGIFIGCSEEMKARFDTQRGDLSRREWLEKLMDLADGVGEIKY